MTEPLRPSPSESEAPSAGPTISRQPYFAESGPQGASHTEVGVTVGPQAAQNPGLTESPDTDDAPPLYDPYLAAHPVAPPPPARARVSGLAVSSLVAAPIGPIGAVLAIVFGWHARQEIDRSGGRLRGHALATAGLVLGALLTPLWGALLCGLLWMEHYRADPQADADEPAAAATSTPDPRRPQAAPPARAPAASAPGPLAPKATRLAREGTITVVDVGIDVTSLSDELARQRAQAAAAGEQMVVMTTAGKCDPCRGVDRSLSDPLLQTALSKVRLVRVDIEVFHEDLDGLRIPHHHFPGFYMLAPDLTPRDGVDGGEWDEDIAPNIAPVLGAFVRGKYSSRRQSFQALPGSGVQL